MPMPSAAVVAAQIASDLGNNDPNSLVAFEKVVARILQAVQAATVTVPGLGLVAPPGTAGGPVTGVSTTGNLT